MVSIQSSSPITHYTNPSIFCHVISEQFRRDQKMLFSSFQNLGSSRRPGSVWGCTKVALFLTDFWSEIAQLSVNPICREAHTSFFIPQSNYFWIRPYHRSRSLEVMSPQKSTLSEDVRSCPKMSEVVFPDVRSCPKSSGYHFPLRSGNNGNIMLLNMKMWFSRCRSNESNPSTSQDLNISDVTRYMRSCASWVFSSGVYRDQGDTLRP